MTSESRAPEDDRAARDPNAELRRLNWALRAHARCSSALIRPNTPQQLMTNVCEAIVESDAYLLAFVGLLGPAPDRLVEIHAQAGTAAGYAKGIVLSGDEDHTAGHGATGRAIRAGSPRIIRDSTLDPTYSYWRERGAAFGIRSSVTVPFKNGSEVIGILNVYGAQPDAFGREEMDLFEQLGGELAFAMALADERTRLRIAEERAREARSELARVSRFTLVGELAASIAHELGQPLTGIKANNAAALRWLALEPANLEEARRSLAFTARDVDRAAEVVQRTRALVLKAAPAEDAVFDLDEAITEVLQMVSDRLRSAGVVASVALHGSLPPVRGDRTQIQQVAVNLIANSIDAMMAVAPDARRLVATTGHVEPDGAFFELADSGLGFRDGAEAHLFEQFYTTKEKGLGLGLSISRSIITAHGGTLTATPGDPTGAIFRFTLGTIP